MTTMQQALSTIIEGGRLGRLVPANDPRSLADAVRRLAGDEDGRRRLRDAGRPVVRLQPEQGEDARLLDAVRPADLAFVGGRNLYCNRLDLVVAFGRSIGLV